MRTTSERKEREKKAHTIPNEITANRTRELQYPDSFNETSYWQQNRERERKKLHCTLLNKNERNSQSDESTPIDSLIEYCLTTYSIVRSFFFCSLYLISLRCYNRSNETRHWTSTLIFVDYDQSDGENICIQFDGFIWFPWTKISLGEHRISWESEWKLLISCHCTWIYSSSSSSIPF